MSSSKEAPKVIVVDDQPGVRILLEETFKAEDCFVLTAENGPEALEILKREKPSAVFIDYKMPMMNGLEVAKKIKEQGLDCKIVLMTAYGEIEKDYNVDVDEYLTKPFDINRAREILHNILFSEPLKA